MHGHIIYCLLIMTESLHHYLTKLTYQRDGAPAHRANDTRLHTTNTVATQQPRPKPRGLCSAGDYAGASLQEEDQGCR